MLATALVLVGLPVLSSLVLMIPAVQTSIVRIVTNRLSEDLNSTISIRKVSILPFAGIRLNGFLVLDQQQDTLFYTEKVRAGVDRFSIRHKHLYLREVDFVEPVINLYQHQDRMNFSFLLDSLGGEKKDSAIWKYSIGAVSITNGKVDISHSIFKNPELSIDKLSFSGLNLKIKRTSGPDEPPAFNVSHFSLHEASGLDLEAFESKGYIKEDRIVIDNLAFRTAASIFDFEAIELPFGNTEVSGYDVPFSGKINNITISPEEIHTYYPKFPLIESPLSLSGTIFGSLDNLKGRNITASFGNNTSFSTSFDITGLSNFNEVFIYMDIEAFDTTIPDLELLIKGSEPTLPESFRQLETIHYSGNITGFINNLVAYGSFTSNLGELSTDLGIKLDKDGNVLFGGLLSTKDFELGRMLNADPALGKISLDMEVSGSRSSETDYFVILDGTVEELELNNYDYQNIAVQGLLTNQKFDGNIRLSDPNGSLNFMGKVDMSGKVPHFDFMALIANAQLDRLNLAPNLEGSVLSVLIETNFSGDNLDDLIGEISISDGLLYTPNSSIDFDSIHIRAERYGESKHLSLRSVFADADIVGHYMFRNLKGTITGFVDNYLPSFIDNNTRKRGSANDFGFDIRLKQVSNLAAIFVPELNISDQGYIKGHFSTSPPNLDLEVGLGHINYKNISTYGFEAKGQANGNNVLSMTSNAELVSIGKLIELPNFSVYQTAASDTLTTNIFWNNWDMVNNSGALYTVTEFGTDEHGHLAVTVGLEPSSVMIADSVWNINKASVRFHDNGLIVEGLKIENSSEHIALNGTLDKEEADGLNLEFSTLRMDRLFGTGKQGRISFGGEIDGHIRVSEYYRDPLLSANVTINDFVFNNERYGTFGINSWWNKETETIEILAQLIDNGEDRLHGYGEFNPEKRHLDLSMDLNRFSISFLDPFINKVMQNMKGYASGKMYFKGPLSQAYLTGKIKVDDGSFGVDMLKTNYHISDSVSFYPNEIRFRDMTLTDRNNRKGKFKGSIFHNGHYKDMVFNLRVESNNMELLNTKHADNEYYYGNIFGNGYMTVTGNTDNVTLTINGTTTGNSRFFIPIQSQETATETNFIRFRSKANGSNLQIQEDPGMDYKVDLSGATINMNIEVTPDAEVQIIFDERIGDILRSKGNGNLQIMINRQGNIRFYGDYIIEEGDYLFSLQNLINKRFTINQGGTVKWQGDPYNADIDITAVYKLRASLADLLDPVSGAISGSSDVQRRVQIHTNLMLSGMLQQPSVRFGLEMPTLDESLESLVLGYITSDEELNRQVLSLLVLNRFYPPEHMRVDNNSGIRSESAALVTTTEMLSSQISRWINTLTSDVDVGVAYRPGDNITSDEFEVAASTQMFNNRVTINGNVGYGKYYTNTGKMVGDFDVDVKLNPVGTLRARAYTRSNEDLIYETSPTTQGIGLSYKEEFNSIKELWLKYKRIFTIRRKDSDNE